MTAEKVDDDVRGKLGPQYLYGTIINVLSLVYGLIIGWTSPMQPLLQCSDNSTLPVIECLNNEEMSWITGTFCLGGIIGTPLAGYMASALGRKKTIIISSILCALCYLLTAVACNSTVLYMARICAGLGGAGACVIVPMYIGETVDNRVRGILGSFMNLSICIGIVGSYAIGAYTSYMCLAIISLVVSVAFVALSFTLPESPTYALLVNQPEAAMNSLRTLRGLDAYAMDREINRIKLEVSEASTSGSMSILDMYRDISTRRALIIALMLMAIQQASGIGPVLNYTVSIFNESGSKVSSDIAAITVGTLQIFGAIASTFLMDRAGRRILMLLSSGGTAISMASIAFFFYAKEKLSEEFTQSIGWLPLASLAVFIIMFAVGYGSVTFVLPSELFKTEARSAGSAICFTVLWAISFFILKFFSSISYALGTDTCFAMFAVFSVLGGLFTILCIPETKGKSIEAIQIALGGKGNESKLMRCSPIPMLQNEEKIKL